MRTTLYPLLFGGIIYLSFMYESREQLHTLVFFSLYLAVGILLDMLLLKKIKDDI